MQKIDLKSAYRSVPIHPDCYQHMGLSWIFFGDQEPTYFYDCRLPFGSSRSCKDFQSISDAIVRIMARENYECISYIDDFLVVAENESKCQNALDFLLNLVPRLGLEVNFDKVSQLATVMSFLGVQINCVHRTLLLPPDKLKEVKELLSKWQTKTRFKKKDLQKIIGK